MLQVHQVGIKLAWRDPLAVHVVSSLKADTGDIELCTEQAFSLSYLSYQALDVNVCLLSALFLILGSVCTQINFLCADMSPCILLIVLFELVIPHEYHPPAVLFAGMCFLAIVPLAYIIGTAVGR